MIVYSVCTNTSSSAVANETAAVGNALAAQLAAGIQVRRGLGAGVRCEVAILRSLRVVLEVATLLGFGIEVASPHTASFLQGGDCFG